MTESEQPTLSDRINSLWHEHESILTSTYQRSTGYLMVNSILVTGSIILLSAIISIRVTFPIILKAPIFTVIMLLIFISWFWFEAAKKIDKIAFDRVDKIEEKLQKMNIPVEGHLWIHSQIRCRWWYQVRATMCWRVLFITILIAGTLTAVFY